MSIYVAIIMLIMLGICFIFAISEASIVAANPALLKRLSTGGDRRAMIAFKLISNRKVLFGTILIGTNVAIVAFSTIGESIPIFHSQNAFELIRNILVLDGIILIFGEVMPKSIAIEAPDRIALIFAPTVAFFGRILKPFVEFSYFIPWLFLRSSTEDASQKLVTERQIELAFIQGSEAGTVEEEEREFGLKVIDFAETTVDRVLTLRGEIFMLPADISVRVAAERMHDIGFSRIPIYESDNEDDIIGFINIKDLIRAFISGQDETQIRDLKREISFIPEKKKILDLMMDFQREHSHIAMVVDESGSITGLVTLEDLLEEVVGEIYDEHDEPTGTIHKLGLDTYLLDGRLELDVVNKALPVKFEESEYETLGGYVMGLFGKVPEEGASIDHEGVQFTIMKMDERRIDKVKIKLIREKEK